MTTRTSMECNYAILEISSSCTKQQLKIEYRRLANKYNYHRNPELQSKFVELRTAYEAICDHLAQSNGDACDSSDDDSTTTEQPADDSHDRRNELNVGAQAVDDGAHDRQYCDDCNIMFNSRKSMKQHHRRSHLMARQRYECAECPKAFRLKLGLQHHISIHHRRVFRLFDCEICGSQFTLRQSLANHQSTFHAKDSTAHQCVKCDKKFKSTINLNAHIRRVHISDNAICDICNNVYSIHDSLKRHVMDKHS